MGIMSFESNPLPDVERLVREYYKGGSVLDFGCGSGRYSHLFPNNQYVGVDGHEGNIEAAKKRYLGKDFHLVDLETWKPDLPYAYLFSSVVMEQLDNLPDESWAKTFILVEPLGHKHDYLGIYQPQVNTPLESVNFMVRTYA